MCKYDETMLGHACTGYGLAFESSTDTTGYDNPNFDLEIENGTLFVTGYLIDAWADAPIDEAEAAKRTALQERFRCKRTVELSNTVMTVYELPCIALEDGNAFAVVGTDTNDWYFVNLLGEDVDCTPLTYEIGRVFGEAIEAFFVRREETVGGIGWSNRDYIIAKTATGEEVLCGCVDWPASMLIE